MTPDDPTIAASPVRPAAAPPANVAHLMQLHAARRPFTRAVVQPVGRDRSGRTAYAQLTFRQLDRESDRLAHGFQQAGVARGTRTIVMVPPGLDFFILTFALFKAGAVPVVVDPGMGVPRMLACLAESRPQAFIGIPKAHLLRRLRPRAFASVTVWITAGRRWLWGGWTLDGLRKRPWKPFPPAAVSSDEPAAILFTTGSTGPAKGAVYTHGNFAAQIRQIQDHFRIGDEEIDLPTFPLFALFDPALGMTAVVPDMDPTRPAHVDPVRIITPILEHGITNMFASPALLDRVGRFGRENRVHLPTLTRVVSAGAPVAPAAIERFLGLLGPAGRVHTPYGATEAVPVTSIASDEILDETRVYSERGFGLCVGRPLSGVTLRIIAITDAPVPFWTDDLPVVAGDVGEIVVRGDLVTRGYFQRAKDDALAKIEADDGFWHRMGDLGWQDAKGRIWYCGRKSQRVRTAAGTLFTIPCEAIFNTHPAVARSALVGVGAPPAQIPVICIETTAEHPVRGNPALARELIALAGRHRPTAEIRHVLFHPRFPVDIRHNAKIFREKLALWAATRIDRGPRRRFGRTPAAR